MVRAGADPRWSDPDYLRRVQNRDGRNLAARAGLHQAYGRGDWFQWHAAQFDWPEQAPEQAKVLELGCGSGAYWADAAAIAPRSLALTLTDFSPGMVDAALARVRPYWPDVAGAAADASALPFESAAFDVVMANHMLYHLPDPSKGVDEIARVLRPGRAALIALNGEGNMRELFALRREVFGGDAFDRVSARFSLETAEPILRARFAQVALHDYPDTLRCTGADDVFAYLTSSPPGADATPAQQAQLRAAIDRAITEGGGALTVHKSVGLFICRKETSS